VKILIPGAAGAMARKVAIRLKESGHEVIGLDRRPWFNAPIEFHEVDIRKRAAEDAFRKARPQAMLHMATVTSLVVPGEERYQINLGGTRAAFEYAREYGVQHCVFVGRHTFYGAGPDSPLFHKEDEPPLELNRFPELADLVAADLYAAAALWRAPELATTVLRFCFTLDRRPRGVFNVAGPQPLPLSRVVREAGRAPFPLPEFVLSGILGRFGLPKLPAGAISHLKYPVVVDASAFRQQTGFGHEHDEIETIRAYRDAVPPAL
jgi:UDP-glucose 4-epimerase